MVSAYTWKRLPLARGPGRTHGAFLYTRKRPFPTLYHTRFLSELASCDMERVIALTLPLQSLQVPQRGIKYALVVPPVVNIALRSRAAGSTVSPS